MRQILIISTILVLSIAVILAAAPPKLTSVPEVTGTMSLSKSTFVDANQILMFVTNYGVFGQDVGQVFLDWPDGEYGVGTWWPFNGDTTSIRNNIDNADDHSLQYGAGLWMGGIVDGEPRVTLTKSTSWRGEYVPGPMFAGSFLPDDPSFKVYKLYSDSLESNPNDDYLNWPVSQGAPVDQAGHPAMLGDRLLWSVFNDADLSRHDIDGGGCHPLGVEVQQTVWAYESTDIDTSNVVFIRYKLYNKGDNAINDFYISLYADMDLGDYDDDMVGCDTLTNLFYTFNSGNGDVNYGSPPPAAGYKILKGPVVPDADSTAYFDGHLLSGFRNLPMTGFIGRGVAYFPSDSLQAYNFMRGLDTDTLSQSVPLESGTTYEYPGDPVAGTGFVYPENEAGDLYTLGSCGPMQFYPG